MRSVVLLLLAPCACNGHSARSELVYDDKPPLEMIQRIESRLAREQCIGSLDRWSLDYRYLAHWYDSDWGKIDKQRVTISYKQADAASPPGAFLDPPNVVRNPKTGKITGTLELDDRDLLFAGGFFEARENKIDYWACGQNLDRRDVQRPFVTLYLDR